MIITPGGVVRAIYGEEIPLNSLGTLTITRASQVEPTPEGAWRVDLALVGGPSLGPYGQRSEALAVEVAWLREHQIPAVHGSPEIRATDEALSLTTTARRPGRRRMRHLKILLAVVMAVAVLSCGGGGGGGEGTPTKEQWAEANARANAAIAKADEAKDDARNSERNLMLTVVLSVVASVVALVMGIYIGQRGLAAYRRQHGTRNKTSGGSTVTPGSHEP